MSVLLIDNPVDLATLVASSAAPLLPGANVQEPDREKFWRSAAGTKSWFDITFGTEAARTYAALLDLNLTSAGKIRLQSWGAALDKFDLRSKEGIVATFTRSDTVSTYFNKYGLLETAITGAPRFDHTTAGAYEGFVVEPTRQNIVLWCRDFTNAAWAKTNVTATKDQAGLDGVTNSASRLVANAASATVLQTITSASATRIQSAFVKRLVGSGVIEMTMDNGTTWVAVSITSASWTRVSIPLQTAVVNPVVGFRITDSGDSIAVDYFQNEAAATVSSPIATTTVAVTRASEAPSVLTASVPGIDLSAMTVAVEFFKYTPNDGGADLGLLHIDNGSTAERLTLLTERSGVDGRAGLLVTASGGTQASVTVDNLVAQAVNYCAARVTTNNARLASNGVLSSPDTAVTMPTGLTTIRIGFSSSAASSGGLQRIRRVRVFAGVVNDADLTTLGSGGDVGGLVPVLEFDWRELPGIDIEVTPTLFSSMVEQVAFGGGSYGLGNYGASAPQSQIDSKNITIIPFGGSYPQKYWRVTLEDANTAYQQMSRLYITTPVEFAYNVSWGWRLDRQARGSGREAIGGRRYYQQRDARLRLSGTFAYLTDAERTAMAIRLFEIGANTPIIFSLYPESTQRGMTTTAYGRLDGASLSRNRVNENEFPFSFIEEL